MTDYILDVVSQTSKLDWAFPFQRTGAFPLDRSAVFSSLEDARNYALGVADGEEAKDERKLGGTSYVGQVISVYEAAVEGKNSTASVNAYIITPDRGLLKLAATTASGDFAADIAALEGKLNTLKSNFEAYQTTVNDKFTTVEQDIEDLKTADSDRYTKAEVDGKIDEVNTSISNVNTAVEAEVTRATEAEEALGAEIDSLLLSVAGKANADDVYTKSDVYTKTEVQTYVANQIGSAGHLKREVVAALPEEAIDEDTIYMVLKENSEGSDVYVEYMYINYQWEVIGDTTVDLSAYAKTEDVNTAIDAVKATVSGVSAAVATKADQSDLEALQNQVAAINNPENGILTQAKKYTNDEIVKVNQTLADKVDSSTYTEAIEGINTAISGINTSISGEDGLAKRLAAVESGKANKGTTLAEYGITDAYTKTETYSQAEVNALIEKVTGGDTSETVISVKNQLDSYITSNNSEIALLKSADQGFETRIAALEDVGAEANVLEAINFNGQDIAIVDKKATFSYTYTLPTAMADALGGVKSSDAENKVSVDVDGYMEVNNLNVNKLTQTEGDTLILNGGSASL